MNVCYLSPHSPNLSVGLDVAGVREQIRFRSGLLHTENEALQEALDAIASKVGIRRLTPEELETILSAGSFADVSQVMPVIRGGAVRTLDQVHIPSDSGNAAVSMDLLKKIQAEQKAGQT